MDDTLFDIRNTAIAHQYCEKTLGTLLRTPNTGIMVTSWTFPHRKFARFREQLKHSRLSDMEIRDLFGTYSSQLSEYVNTLDRPNRIAHGTYVYPGNHVKAPEQWNNMMFVCYGDCGKEKDCEWVSWGGPYGYNQIETLTRSPLHAMTLAARLILSASGRDLLWFTRYDKTNNAFSVTHVMPVEHMRRAILLGRWPYSIRGFG